MNQVSSKTSPVGPTELLSVRVTSQMRNSKPIYPQLITLIFLLFLKVLSNFHFNGIWSAFWPLLQTATSDLLNSNYILMSTKWLSNSAALLSPLVAWPFPLSSCRRRSEDETIKVQGQTISKLQKSNCNDKNELC